MAPALSSRAAKARTGLALLALASATLTSAAYAPPGGGGGGWWKRQDPSDAQVLKLISASPPYATMLSGNPDLIASAVGLSGDLPSTISSAAISAQTASAIVQAVQPSSTPDKVASDTLSPSQEALLASELQPGEGGVESWTFDPGAYGCGFNNGVATDVATATLCSVSAPSNTASAQALLFSPVPTVVKRQDSDLFPLFTSYNSLPSPSTTFVYFGPTPNINIPPTSAQNSGNTGSGNGVAPSNINNPNSPDLGWLDIQVGAVPYKNGDLIASIVWILATIALIPLLLIRLLRRSSLISHVLVTVIIYMVLTLVAFGVRAKLANQTPTTPMMNVEGVILAVLLPLLIEPLLHLLGLYSQQSGRSTGVPQASLVLRILNLVVFILFLTAAGYYASWLDKWNNSLQNTFTAQSLPNITPPKVTRIAPVVGAVVEIIVILGAALLIPVARGDAGSMRPGGFIFILLLLLFISTVYRLLQALHATTRIAAELGGNLNSNDLLPFFQGGSSNTTSNNQKVAQGLSLAPQGMYGPNSEGIDWEQLQLTMASRGTPQTPLIFNLVYVLPMWLMVFLLFFAHAPASKGKDGGDGGDGNTAVAEAKA